MTDRPETPPPALRKPAPPSAREARLAQALRDNLRRRKSRERARADEAAAPLPDGDDTAR